MEGFKDLLLRAKRGDEGHSLFSDTFNSNKGEQHIMRGSFLS